MDFFEPGFILDDFELGPVLREGAMARIYRATDRLTEETVALKVPFKDILNNPLLYYHHQNEDRVLRRLAHPYIVRSIRRPRSSLYLVLEWVDGPDLKSLLWHRGKFQTDQVVAWAGQILEALVYMHGRGVHHMDIKPENILRAPDRRIKLVDFGLAWMRGRHDLLTEDFNNPHGTPDYAAPEQIRGVRHDQRSDLYSLGLVLYELLTGAFPFKRSKQLREVRKRVRMAPVPLRHHDPDLPVWLETFIMQALAPEPEARYPSARAMAAALQAGEAVGQRGINRIMPVTERAGTGPVHPDAKRARPQLLGAVTDHPAVDGVIDVLRREALKLDGEITLLTVNTEMDDSDLVRYATAIEGAQLGRRLEGYVHVLRNHGLNPQVRIRRGDRLEEILDTARNLSADLIVVGATRRRGFQRLFGGRLVDKIIRRADCRVIVADRPILAAPTADRIPSTLQSSDLLEIDFFLHDNWVGHLNHLAAVSRPYPVSEAEGPGLGDCPLQVWLQTLQHLPEWRPLVSELVARHQRLHVEMDNLAQATRDGNDDRMRQIYLNTALPLICDFQQALRELSLALKTRTAARQAILLPLTREENCPLETDGSPPDGPLGDLKTIRDFFCRHPDASPEACLMHLRGRIKAPENN